MKKSEALSVLGLSDGASEADIKKAHRKLIIENHPDKFGTNEAARKKAEEKTKIINEARDVLLSGKWDPEYYSPGTPYGAPFSYNPYTSRPTSGRRSTGSSETNPFDDWPFVNTTFVWTSWDPHSTTNTQGWSTHGTDWDVPGGFPFNVRTTVHEPTPQERYDLQKKHFADELKFVGFKLVVLLACVLVNVPALGLYLYTIASIWRGIWKRLGILSVLMVLPLLFVAFIFLPTAIGPVGIMGALFFGVAAYFDLTNAIKAIQKLRALKKQL